MKKAGMKTSQPTAPTLGESERKLSEMLPNLLGLSHYLPADNTSNF